MACYFKGPEGVKVLYNIIYIYIYICALQGANISPIGTFEDDFNFLKVGYVSFLEGYIYIYMYRSG